MPLQCLNSSNPKRKLQEATQFNLMPTIVTGELKMLGRVINGIDDDFHYDHRRGVIQDFSAYLLHQRITYYVTYLVRENKKNIDELKIPLF